MNEDNQINQTNQSNQPKPKVFLMLQDSPSLDHGLVLDCEGHHPATDDAMNRFEVVGNWYRHDKGTIFLELTNTIDARQDVLINLLKNVRKSRIENFGDPLIVAKYPQRVDTSGIDSSHKRRASKTSANKTSMNCKSTYSTPTNPTNPTNPANTTNTTNEQNVTAEFNSLRDKLLKGRT